jgi:hypothetical protein
VGLPVDAFHDSDTELDVVVPVTLSPVGTEGVPEPVCTSS